LLVLSTEEVMAVQSPEEAVRAMADAFNSRDLDAFMAFYEPGATLVPQPGRVASGEPVTMNGRVTDVVRRQPDGTWRWVIDVPYGIG